MVKLISGFKKINISLFKREDCLNDQLFKGEIQG